MGRLTKREIQQETAANILICFSFIESMDEFWETYNDVFKTYDLCDDPFTYLPCSPREYAKNSLEYAKQTMIEKYGHCDGLE